MAITEKFLRSCFYPTDLARGRSYYERGRVLRLEQANGSGKLCARAYVQGTRLYEVEVEEYPDGRLAGYCSCPRFDDAGSCKHLAAVCLMLLDRQQEMQQNRSDAGIAMLLHDYLERDRLAGEMAEAGDVRLYPSFSAAGGGP